MVGLDGWVRLLNQHPAFDGMSFSESEQLEDGVPTWIECTIHRIDRRVPMTVKEYLAESKRETDAWTSHPRRMLRHRAIVQCARLALALPELVSLDDRVEPLDALNGTQGPKNEKEKLPVKQKAGPQASHGRNHSSTDQLIQIISCAP